VATSKIGCANGSCKGKPGFCDKCEYKEAPVLEGAKNCPFCGSDHIKYFGTNGTTIYCRVCQAEGPESDGTLEDALRGWNARKAYSVATSEIMSAEDFVRHLDTLIKSKRLIAIKAHDAQIEAKYAKVVKLLPDLIDAIVEARIWSRRQLVRDAESALDELKP
jgi:hypothetical protein